MQILLELLVPGKTVEGVSVWFVGLFLIPESRDAKIRIRPLLKDKPL